MRSEGCPSVRPSLPPRVTKWPRSDTNGFSGLDFKNGDFPETTAFGRYGVKTSENANMLMSTSLTAAAATISTTEASKGVLMVR